MEKHIAIPKFIFRRIAQKSRKNHGKNYARYTIIYSLFIICSQKFNNFSSIFYHLYHCTKAYKMCNLSYIAQKHFRIVKNFCAKKQKENFSYVFCAFWRKILHKSRACFLCNMYTTSFVNMPEKSFLYYDIIVHFYMLPQQHFSTHRVGLLVSYD